MPTKLILTCEHAAGDVPKSLKSAPPTLTHSLLQSHRGWDAGALKVASSLQKNFQGELHQFRITRLLVDANRTLKGTNDLPTYGRELEQAERLWLFNQYKKYRATINQSVTKRAKSKASTFILSVHTFTPSIKNKTRATDIGLLFRTGVAKELEFAVRFKRAIKVQPEAKNWNIHFNRPYRGFTDCCLNDVLDGHLGSSSINGLFLEINQRILRTQSQIKNVSRALHSALEMCL